LKFKCLTSALSQASSRPLGFAGAASLLVQE
jgi:hypothetical protein